MRNTRWGTLEELANLIVFAISDRASFVNGAVLVTDNAMDKSSSDAIVDHRPVAAAT